MTRQDIMRWEIEAVWVIAITLISRTYNIDFSGRTFLAVGGVLLVWFGRWNSEAEKEK